MLAVVNDIKYVVCIAPEAIKPPDDQLVAFSEELNYCRKFGAAFAVTP